MESAWLSHWQGNTKDAAAYKNIFSDYVELSVATTYGVATSQSPNIPARERDKSFVCNKT